MPAAFVVRSIHPNNGIIQVHLSREWGQPNDVLLNVTAETLADICGKDVREGDLREVSVRLLARAGTNGKERL